MLITIPYPPSVNSYWRTVNGRTMLSKRASEYKRVVAKAVMIHAANKHLGGRLEVDLVVHPPQVNRRRDIDNLAKGVLDSLQSAGVYLDDSQIDKLTITRAEPVPGGVIIATIIERRGEGEQNRERLLGSCGVHGKGSGKHDQGGANPRIQKSPAPKRRAGPDKGKTALAGMEGDHARPAPRKKADQGGKEGGEKRTTE